MTPPTATRKWIRRPIRSVDALLDVGSSPLAEPCIHPEVSDSIWAEALRKKEKGKSFAIELDVPPEDIERLPEVTAAIHYHFEKRCRALEDELREIFHDGWRSLAIGSIFVAILIMASEALVYFNTTRTAYVISESMIIIAWVVLWHPADLLLYAHFPIRHQLRTARALAKAEIRLRENTTS